MQLDAGGILPHPFGMAGLTEPKQRKAIGKRVQWAREQVEPNRSEFARAIGVDVSTIRNIENGTRGASVALLQSICHSLRISFEYVLTGSLNGVDPVLARLLVAFHPELAVAPTAQPKRGSRRTGDRRGTSQKPTAPASRVSAGQ